jgi:prophage DNA circulation protein
MATWRERLRTEMKMVSPEGEPFFAKWRQSPRSFDKKLGIFEYPLVKGTVVQDLDVTSYRWPLTFYFDGPDHDLTADKFMKAAQQRGQWSITHPVYGFKGLQLMTITEVLDPTEQGNISEFNSEWIEPIDPQTLKTAAELSDAVGIQADLVAISAADQFVAGLDTSLDFSIVNAINSVTNAVNEFLGPIASLSTGIYSEFLAIQNATQDLLAAAILNPLSIAGNLQALVELPLLAINDISSRLSAYANLAGALFNIKPDEGQVNNEGRNKAHIQQIALTSTVTANAKIVTVNPAEGGLKSQSQAVKTAQNISDQLDLIVANLEESQVLFEDKDIEDQHFAQEQSHNETMLLTRQAIEFLITSSFNLKIERRFKLDRPRCPVEIATVEYNGPGENDANIDLFIESNKLKGYDILLLPALTEVLVYG